MITVTPLTEQQIQSNVEQSIIDNITDSIQRYMDATVQTRGYDNIFTACTYSTSTNVPFQLEGQACVVWRDQVWLHCYQVLANVQQGLRAIPTVPELIAELPTLNWPART